MMISSTGNGVNHPNDFGHRVYAQVLSALLIPAKASSNCELIPDLVWQGQAPPDEAVAGAIKASQD